MSETDKIKDFHGFKIQHGHYNDRVYVINGPIDIPEKFPSKLISFAKRRGYGKIFAKIRKSQKNLFKTKGFRTEAEIPGFYKGEKTACFLGYYLDKERQHDSRWEDYCQTVKLAQEQEGHANRLKKNYTLVKCTIDDAQEITEVYRRIFPTYPFPIHNPDYIIETMSSHVDYFSIKQDSRILALSSAEKDMKSLSVEMTDFATLPAFRGLGFAKALLIEMEKQCRILGINTAYTIARAASKGMNIIFGALGYTYRGRLINNTNISGQLESMNVWSKKLNENS